MHQGSVTAALRNGLVGFLVGALVRDRKTGFGAALGLAVMTALARLSGHDPEDVEFIEVVDEHGHEI